MKVEILLDHPAGLKKGQKVDVNEMVGNKLITDKIAKKVGAKKATKKAK
jgi:hypothetical protein